MFVPAVPGNIVLARQALAGLADAFGIDAARVADMKVAVTEACTNAVVHGYGGRGGSLEVAMGIEPGRLVVLVRDRGVGLRSISSSRESPALGFGLALIAALSDEFGIAGGRHGTEVRISFALEGDAEAQPPVVALAPAESSLPDGIVLELAPGGRAAAVLSRVVSLVAARAEFSIDRLSDAQIVSDAIAGSGAAQALDGTLCVRVDEHDRGFALVVGPLVPGGGHRLVEDTKLPGLGCLLTNLADGLDVEPIGDDADAELLRVRLDVRS
jgi:serine/threonine-protein kinase RsbW